MANTIQTDKFLSNLVIAVASEQSNATKVSPSRGSRREHFLYYNA